MADKGLPCPTVLRLLLRYEPETGRLFWRERARVWFKNDKAFRWWNKMFAGNPACDHLDPSSGYRVGTLFGRCVLAHRVAFAVYHGVLPLVTDHINGDRSDNRAANLRSVTKAENAKNVVLSSSNTTGLCGVYKAQASGRWYAQIRINGVKTHLGFFDSPELASKARERAKAAYGYHAGHGLTAEERIRLAQP